MRLNHVSYVTSQDRLTDTVQRLCHRNFTPPLQNGHYIKVVCPRDYPITDGIVSAKVFQVERAGDPIQIKGWLGSDSVTALSSEIEVMCLIPADAEVGLK
jgi:hypothetical protein